MSPSELQYLRSLGFKLPLALLEKADKAASSCDFWTPSGYDSAALVSAAQEMLHYRPQYYNRRLIEFCCGRNSRLGRPFPWNDGCDVVRLTMDDDVTTERGLARAIAAVRDSSLPVLLWASIPCTGGSPWQNLNAKRGASTRKLIARRIRDFRLIWASFVQVAAEVVAQGGVFCVEWPKDRNYWRRPEVVRVLTKYHCSSSVFHGCQYGLVSQFGSTKGMPILKPWRIAGNLDRMLVGLNCLCKGVGGIC